MKSVGEILNQANRTWFGSEPASEEEISELIAATSFNWPEPLLDLWRFSNGGEGELALPPMWFVLPATTEVVQLNLDCNIDDEYQGFRFFGTNGGLETIGMDIRNPDLPIFAIDLIAGTESLLNIADNASAFVEAIGLEYIENA